MNATSSRPSTSCSSTRTCGAACRRRQPDCRRDRGRNAPPTSSSGSQRADSRSSVTDELAAALEAAALVDARWFGGKGTPVEAVRLAGSLGPFSNEWLLAASVSGASSAEDVYLFPARLVDGALADA